MDNPVSPEYIGELCPAIYEAMDVETRYRDFQRLTYFDDVSRSDWFFEDVCLAYENGLMLGVSDDSFSPLSDATRAMAATIMWRLEGGQEAVGSAFTDLKAGAWYEDAVNWAAENGIVDGCGDGTFRPDRAVTREEMAKIVYNTYHLEIGGAAPAALSFADADQISPWAVTAMEWCVANDIYQGDSDGMLSPGETLDRAELAAVLVRLTELLGDDAAAVEPAPAGVSAPPAGPMSLVRPTVGK